MRMYSTLSRPIELEQRSLSGYPRGIMVKTMDSGIVVSDFELNSLYSVRFRTNILGKGINPLNLQGMS